MRENTDPAGVWRLSRTPSLRIAVPTVASVLLGVLFVGRHSFWYDESFSVTFSHASLTQLWSQFGGEANMALYYVILHFWLTFGDGEVTVRLLSVALAAAAVPLVYAVASRLFSGRQATFATALLVVSPTFVAISQEARSYALTLFLVALASYLFVRGIQRSSRAVWIAYVVVGGASVYSHFFAGFVLVAHLCSVPFAPAGDRPSVRRLAAVYGSIAVIAIPALDLAERQSGTVATWIPRPGPMALPRAFEGLAGGTKALLVMAFLAWILFLATAWRQRRDPGSWRYAFVISWLVVPVVTSFAISFVRPIFTERYLVVVLPALFIGMGVGISSIRPRALGLVALACALIVSGHGVWAYYHDPGVKENWRLASSLLLRREHAGDGLLVTPAENRIALDYYFERQHDPTVIDPLYPSLPWHSGLAAGAQPAPSAQGLPTVARPYSRVWLIRSTSAFAPSMPAGVVASIADRPLLGTWSFEGERLELYGGVRPASGSRHAVSTS